MGRWDLAPLDQAEEGDRRAAPGEAAAKQRRSWIFLHWRLACRAGLPAFQLQLIVELSFICMEE